MAYQISALFSDGHLFLSDISEAETPTPGQYVRVNRGEESSLTIVEKLKSKRIIPIHGPLRTIDEVHVREIDEARGGWHF
jgi:hypothetical protein